jgi:hypothetical protein
MKQYTMGLRLKTLLAILLLCLSVIAQQRQDKAVKQELAVEVSHGDDGPWRWEIPAFNGGGGEGGNFRHIESWKPSSGEAPVASIVFKIGRDADIVIVDLSVRLENEKVVAVGTYRLRESETVRTEELTKFGVEPLVLKIVKAKPGFKDPFPAILPQLENKTKAIEVVSFYQDAPPSDSFRLTLKNVSTRKIMALDLFMPSPDGNGGSGDQSHGAPGHPLMLPGDVSVQFIGVGRGGRMTAEGYVPDVQLQRTLIIRTVVFDDGTYDGEVGPAAEMEARRRGQDLQRKRIIPLLQSAMDTEDKDALTTVNDLKEQAYGLGRTADTSVVEELIARYPSLNEKSRVRVTQDVETGLRDGKLEFLRYIKEFEDTPKQGPEHANFQAWLKKTKANYENLRTSF